MHAESRNNFVKIFQKDPENDIKPVYAVGEIEWGAWRDAQSRTNKYWYWGYLRRYEESVPRSP